MKYFIQSALFLFLMSCLSFGIDNLRTCKIIFVEQLKSPPAEVYLFDGVLSRKIALPTNNLSEEIQLPEGDLVLCMSHQPVLKSEDMPEGSPTLKVPRKVRNFYLIVVSDLENKTLPLRLLPVNTNEKMPKLGQTLWVNLTSKFVKAELGKVSVTIPPNEKVLSDAPLSESGYFKADFQYQSESEGEYFPVMKKSWWFDAQSKHLGIITDSEKRIPRIFAVRDKPASD